MGLSFLKSTKKKSKKSRSWFWVTCTFFEKLFWIILFLFLQKLEEDFKREESERSQFYQNFTGMNMNQNYSTNQRPSSPHQSSTNFYPTHQQIQQHSNNYHQSPIASVSGSSQKQMYYSTVNNGVNSISSASTHSNILPTESVYSFMGLASYANGPATSSDNFVYSHHNHNHHHHHPLINGNGSNSNGNVNQRKPNEF